MREYRSKINENGRIVIPAACRQMLHLESGDDVIIRIHNNEMHIFSAKLALVKAQQLVEKHAKNKDLVKELKSMRREDADNE